MTTAAQLLATFMAAQPAPAATESVLALPETGLTAKIGQIAEDPYVLFYELFDNDTGDLQEAYLYCQGAGELERFFDWLETKMPDMMIESKDLFRKHVEGYFNSGCPNLKEAVEGYEFSRGLY